jgi:hypothetical protein
MQLPRIDAHLSPSHFLTFSLSHFLLHHSDTSDGRRSSLIGRRSRKCRHSSDQRETGIRRRGKIYHQATKTPREDSQGGRGGQGENIHHKGTKDTKGKRCKPQAPRTRRKEGYGLWIIHPCFRPPIVRVVPGHGEKILTTENTEDTENRWLALFIPCRRSSRRPCAPNAEVTGAARLYRAASGGPQGYASPFPCSMPFISSML